MEVEFWCLGIGDAFCWNNYYFIRIPPMRFSGGGSYNSVSVEFGNFKYFDICEKVEKVELIARSL